MHTDGVDVLNSFSMICNIEDCSFCQGALCTKGLFQDSKECREQRNVPGRLDVQLCSLPMFRSRDLVRVDIDSTSKGQQTKWLTKDRKWLIKERFYYQCRFWNDPLVEAIGSKVCESLHISSVKYQLCTVDGRLASLCKMEDDKFIPLKRLDKKGMLEEYSGEDRIKFVRETISNQIGYDTVQYLADMTLADFIVGNEDRHCGNFGIGSRGLFPLFDFGLGLFEHDYIYSGLSLTEAIPKMNKQPFGRWDIALDYFSKEGVLKTGTVDLSGYILPNNLASEYLRYSTKKVGVNLCGI